MTTQVAVEAIDRDVQVTGAEEPIPFAIGFKTAKAAYIYDVGTNRLLRVSSESGRAFDRLQTDGWPDDREAAAKADDGFAQILRLRDRGLLSSGRSPPAPVLEHRKCLEERILNALSQLTLEITEGCNLRCRYCIYGAGYEGQRTHGYETMRPETVDKAIEYFFSHNRTSSFISVGFYGGEPLTAFADVTRATDEVRSHPRGRDVHLTMTTNGTLLTPEKYRFLVDNDFALLVSLDGPQSIHDCYRRAAGGRGTYATIMRNLTSLRDYAPEFFENRVMFSTVHAPATSYRRLLTFFSRSPIARNQAVQLSGVSPGCPALMNQLLAEVKDWGEVRMERDEMMHEFISCVSKKRTTGARFRFLRSLHAQPFISWHRREYCAGPQVPCGLNGMCIPGWRKLFVATDGTFHTCERVGRDWPIGHVDRGIDVEAIFRYLGQHYRFTDKHCHDCWAKRLCGACMSTIGSKDGVDPRKIREFCAGERQCWADTIILHTRLLESDPQAWDFIEEIMVS